MSIMNEARDLEVGIWPADGELDGGADTIVVQIDTGENTGKMRVNVNEATVWDGNPEDTEFDTRLQRIAGSISLGMNCEIRLGFSKEGRRFVQIQCWRMDVITQKEGWGYGGKAYPSEHATDSEIIQMIFGLYKGYWEHEARETFVLRNEAGEGRRPFGPHIDTWALWSVARKVDIRSAQHKED